MVRLRLLLERMEVLLMRRIWTLVAAQLCVVSMLVLWRDLEPRELRMRVVLMLLEYLLLLMLSMLVREVLERVSKVVRALSAVAEQRIEVEPLVEVSRRRRVRVDAVVMLPLMRVVLMLSVRLVLQLKVVMERVLLVPFRRLLMRLLRRDVCGDPCDVAMRLTVDA